MCEHLLELFVCVFGKQKDLLRSTLAVQSSEGVEQTLSLDTPIHHSEAESSLK